MNFKKFLIEQGIISEAPRSADVDYEEKKNKAGEITEVIATLKQQKASAATKIINDFVEADEEMKKFQDIRDKVRPDLLEKLNALFDLNDELTTRRIKTAKWILTISKKSPKAGTPDKTELDEESFFKEISTLTGMELEAIKALKEKFMKVIKGKPGEGFTEPKITSAVMKEGVSDTLKTWISNVVSMFKTKIIPNIDQKLNSLMKKYK